MSMEVDDLDNLIADSIGGVNSALEAEKKGPTNTTSDEWAKEAVRDLQGGPSRPEGEPNEEFFASLLKTFQDPNFQKAMSDAMQQGAEEEKAAPKAAAPALPSPEKEKEKASGTSGTAAAAAPLAASSSKPSGTASSSSAAAVTEQGAEDFLQNFLQSFDKAVGEDPKFEQSLSSLMGSMLSNDLLSDPIKQITEKMEPWLKSQKGLPAAERKRYEDQLDVYHAILGVYRSRPDPLPEDAREEVQRLIGNLQLLGQPPDEVMQQIQPAEPPEGGECMEDFMKAMGLGESLGAGEQDLLQKLTNDPEELTKVMKDLSAGFSDEGCKQQ
mmetsp:Transcript_21113/g.45776  ORF Transcript_21113/g.45776 Transcript_21113/m.45776 type:complete len:327 (-) Transcript_21113:217-1197(-)